jgi:L-ribulose-5-phosphate 4-epimerase
MGCVGNRGLDPADAVVTAVALEEIALIAFHTMALEPGQQGIEDWLLKRHYFRKHGDAAYYGQPDKRPE